MGGGGGNRMGVGHSMGGSFSHGVFHDMQMSLSSLGHMLFPGAGSHSSLHRSHRRQMFPVQSNLPWVWLPTPSPANSLPAHMTYARNHPKPNCQRPPQSLPDGVTAGFHFWPDDDWGLDCFPSAQQQLWPSPALSSSDMSLSWGA